MKKNISTNIRDERIKKGYKQQYMAHQMQMTQANYSKIETGKVVPSINQIEKLASILGITNQEIMGDNDENTGSFEQERKLMLETIESQKQIIHSQQVMIDSLSRALKDSENKMNLNS